MSFSNILLQGVSPAMRVGPAGPDYKRAEKTMLRLLPGPGILEIRPRARKGTPMKLKLWQIDAFAERPFAGNPAAVVPLTQSLPDATMQAIANENNLAETAFLVAREPGFYELRWFTPTMEVPLCGHATLASAWVIFSELAPGLDRLRFATKSGVLTVERGADGRHLMAMPAGSVESFAAPSGFGEEIGESLGVAPPDEWFLAPTGAGGTPAPLGVWREASLRAMKLGGKLQSVLARAGAGALLATAKGDGAPYDYLARFFAPGMGVPEDPVTGSMNCTLTPFWAKRLGKRRLRAYQASPRGGDILCTDEDGRVILSGPCALYMRGEIEV
jgi:PhzF family phenazine biosynthesis protein